MPRPLVNLHPSDPRVRKLRETLRDILERFRNCAEHHHCPGNTCVYCEADLYPDFINEILAVLGIVNRIGVRRG